jgi:chromosome segregation ATPase
MRVLRRIGGVMVTLFKGIMGNGSAQLTDEVRAVLQQISQERGHCEALIKSARTSLTRVQEMGKPMEKVGSDMDELTARLAGIDHRVAAFDRVAALYPTLDERAEQLAEAQGQTDARIARAAEETERIAPILEELLGKVDQALALKERLETFLDLDRPFQQLQVDADTLRVRVDETTEHLGRMREQHERIMDAHKIAIARIDAFERRREELTRGMADDEKRLTGIERGLRGLADAEQTIEDTARRLGTVKALGDAVAQQVATLEAQREAVERAIGRADHLDKSMRQVDAGVRQQQENAALLAELKEQIASLQSLHEGVAQRAEEIDEVQRTGETQIRMIRQDLDAARSEVRQSVERFDFERSGLESVSERVSDLRSALTDFETRFSGLASSVQVVDDLDTRTAALTEQVDGLAAGMGRLDEEVVRAQEIRHTLDEATQAVAETVDIVSRIQQSRPAVEAALRDAEQLRGSHALVRDAIEQVQVASSEIGRVREQQSETRSWLATVERMLGELREGVGELEKLSPTVESAHRQMQKVNESMSAIEARRESIEELHRRLSEVGAISSTLEEQGRSLRERMDEAEQRFTVLDEHAAEAERLGQVMGAVSIDLQEAERDTGTLTKRVVAAQERCDSIESLAERLRSLRDELEQRQHALEESARDLQHASELRQEAAASVQELDDRTLKLTAALTDADRRTQHVDTLSARLEERAEGLHVVEARFGQFEARLTSFERMERDIARALEQMASRQGTVEALQADLDRMFKVAEKTAADVRTITKANHRIEESRELLDVITAQLHEVRDTSSLIEQRRRQMSQAEDRLSRAEALLIEIRSSLELLQGQKVIVEHAVEKAGALRFLLKQAEATIEELRDERHVAARLRGLTPVTQEVDDGAIDADASVADDLDADAPDADAGSAVLVG